MAVSVLCLFDKRGKEVYFDESPTEVTFAIGKTIKSMYASFTIRTDDWGYFYRAFESTRDNENSYWKDYDVFLAIACTAGVTGILWIVCSIIDVFKFTRAGWHLSCCVFDS